MKTLLLVVSLCTFSPSLFCQGKEEQIRKIDSVAAAIEDGLHYRTVLDSSYALFTKEGNRAIRNVDCYYIDSGTGQLKKVSRMGTYAQEGLTGQKQTGKVKDIPEVYADSIFFSNVPTVRKIVYYFDNNTMIKATETRVAGDTVLLTGTYYFGSDGEIIRAKEKKKRQSVRGSIGKDAIFISWAAFFLKKEPGSM